MKRPLKAEEARLWAKVAKTVRLAPGRAVPPVAPALQSSGPAAAKANNGIEAKPAPNPTPPRPKANTAAAPHVIEPLRKRRLVRERDEIEARLDLHGLDQDRARAVLHDFLLRAHGRGVRAVLVITGKGALGDGVLRRRTPEWLAEPHVRPIIAGVSQAARHHGGEGALYIALKRRPT